MAVQRLSNSGRSGFSYKSLIAGITPLPSVPTIGAATAVNFESVNVAFTAPGAYAGSTYTATSSPGGFTGTSATSPILVSGLSELTEYTFTVTATNATGTSGASASSSPVTTPAGDTGVMYPLGMVSVGAAGSSEIQFTSIPSTYTHLQIRGIGKVVGTSSFAMDVWIQFNTDTGSNYSRHLLAGDSGSGAYAGAGTNTDHITIATFPDNYFGSSFFSSFVCDILDYANTNKYTTVRSLGGYEVNNATYNAVKFFSGNWRNTNAITSIKIFVNGKTLDQYSHFALYGIKGA